MRIEIEIPKEFEKHFKKDKFKYGFDRFLREYNSELLRVAHQVDISYEYDDVCECRQLKDYNSLFKTSCGYIFAREGFKYCPYCGKKIKVIQNDN